jgi:FKBP-type peptidyl-prolyl cis-trans isomerase SlyD
MRISTNTVVTLEYVMTNTDGRLLASSESQGPMLYLHGSDGIIPGLAQRLEGRTAGERLVVTLAPGQAFGEHDPEKVFPVQRRHFVGVDRIEPGMRFHAQGDGGAVRMVTVRSADEHEVVLDANHPWAGLTVTCSIIIREVREAKPTELEHGHACYGDHSCDRRHCEMK